MGRRNLLRELATARSMVGPLRLDPIIAPGLVLVVGLVIASCSQGAPAESSAHASVAPTSQATSEPTASPAVGPSVSPVPSLLAGWHEYTSTQSAYTMQYPPTWFKLPTSGAPDTDTYFSNEVVGAPLELDPAGVWLTIRVDQSPALECGSFPTAPGTRVLTQSPITLGGVLTTEYVVDVIAPAAEAAYEVVAAALHDASCYGFIFLSSNPTARQQNLSVINTVMSTFRFS